MVAKSRERGEAGHVFLLPVDGRSRELVPRVLHKYMNLFTIVYDKGILSACGEIIAFRWDDN